MRASLITGFRIWAIGLIMLALAIPGLADPTTAVNDYTRVQRRVRELGNANGIKVASIGSSGLGRPIYAITLIGPSSTPATRDGETRLLFIAGQHGNEPLPVFASMDFVESLVRKGEAARRRDLGNVVLVVVPVANPDGFAAHRRANDSGVDLNRDWESADQPETKAISQLISRFRPHVLVDEHQWMSDDSYSPNCIEVAGFGRQAEQRLARLLAYHVRTRLMRESLRLQPTYYRQQSDARMAHRWFEGKGICSLLVETSPDWPRAERLRAYKQLMASLLDVIGNREEPLVVKHLAMVKRQRPQSSEWLASLYSPKEPSPRPNDRGSMACLVALIAVAALIAGRAASGKQTAGRVWSAREEAKWLPVRAFSMTEAVQSDLSIRAKLALIQQYRQRPCDRGKSAFRAEESVAGPH
jgi:hypothetical protein